MFPDINVTDIGRIDVERKRDAHHAKTKLAALQYHSGTMLIRSSMGQKNLAVLTGWLPNYSYPASQGLISSESSHGERRKLIVKKIEHKTKISGSCFMISP